MVKVQMNPQMIRLYLTCVLTVMVGSCQSVPTLPGADRNLRYLSQGNASWYGDDFHGRKTASGEAYDMHDLTAAHPSLPFGSVVVVQEVSTGKTVTVRINDRGPFAKGRVIDLSFQAAKLLGLIERGVGRVKLFVRKPSS